MVAAGPDYTLMFLLNTEIAQLHPLLLQTEKRTEGELQEPQIHVSLSFHTDIRMHLDRPGVKRLQTHPPPYSSLNNNVETLHVASYFNDLISPVS